LDYYCQVKHGYCGPVESIEVQRQLVARTPVFYRLEQLDNGVTPVGYIRLKEFNALARKDLVIGQFFLASCLFLFQTKIMILSQ